MKVTPIIFKENGFFYENIFYAYQCINYINEIKRFTADDFIKVRLGYCNKADAIMYMQYYFIINMKDNKSIELGGDSWTVHLYKKVPVKNKLLRYLIGKFKYVRNDELDNFIKFETDEMKQYKFELETLRFNLINKFNKWNNK